MNSPALPTLFVRYLLAAACSVQLIGPAQGNDTDIDPQRPNVVLIVADDK